MFTLSRQLFAAEADRLVLWSPVPVMAGVAAYFALAGEPPAWAAAVPMGLCAALLWYWRGRPLRWLALPVFLACLGFTAGQVRTYLCRTPLLGEEIHNRDVEGVIDEIDRQEKGVRLILAQPVVEGLSWKQTPVRVRVSFRAYDPSWQIGDMVRMKATLYPPPQPGLPGGYDFARHLYFLRIGAGGFALHPPEVVDHVEGLRFRQWLNALRHSIGDDMRARMPGAAGTVAAAMTVGETGPIPEATKALLRDSGLSHMLAIAGLHLGLVAGIVFFTVRLLLVLYPPVGLRINAKKIAAVFGLLSTLVYLALAGFPIPAERSFIMASFVFVGILLDRRGVSLRTLMFSAIFILCIMPESLFGASFQMSFSATLAIVAVYERFGRYLYRPGDTFTRHVLNHAYGIMATSLAATCATAPFVLYNFDRFALFGVIANMMVIPLAGLIIMPGVVLSLLLMPVGLQGIGYWPLEHGVEWMMAASRWTTSLPYAALLMPAPSVGGMLVSAFGLMWLCLMRQRWRLLGIPLFIAGVATMALHRPPDVFISGDARQVMARTQDGGYTMLKGAARSFTAQAWLRAEGKSAAVPRAETDVQCDRAACRYRNVIVLKHPQEAVEEACTEHADVLVAWWYLHRAECPGPLVLIGRDELEKYGAHTLWLQPGKVRIMRVWEEGRGGRPWQVIPKTDEDEEED